MALTEHDSQGAEQVPSKGDLGTSEEARLPDRREFFRRISLDAITSVSSALMGQRVLENLSAPVDSGGVVGTDSGPYQGTNAVTELVTGVSFHNLGVYHTSLHFMRERRTVLGAMRRADVVLLEGFTGQSYFDNLATLAHEDNKIVVRLEGGLSRIPDLALTANPLVVTGTLCANLIHLMRRLGPTRDQPPEKAPTEQPSLRRALFTVCSYLLSEAFRVYQVPSELKNYPSDDWSYIMDGRTVLMLDEIRKIATCNPDLSIVAITGESHARGFSFYTACPENMELFERKLRFYKSVYKSWLGGTATLERDIARA